MKNKKLNEILNEINNQAIELEQDSGVDEFTEYIKGMRYVLNEIKWFIDCERQYKKKKKNNNNKWEL